MLDFKRKFIESAKRGRSVGKLDNVGKLWRVFDPYHRTI